MTARSCFPGRGTLIEETLLRGEAKGLVAGLTACTGVDVLDRWFERAVTAESAQDVLGAEG